MSVVKKLANHIKIMANVVISHNLDNRRTIKRKNPIVFAIETMRINDATLKKKKHK